MHNEQHRRFNIEIPAMAMLVTLPNQIASLINLSSTQCPRHYVHMRITSKGTAAWMGRDYRYLDVRAEQVGHWSYKAASLGSRRSAKVML